MGTIVKIAVLAVLVNVLAVGAAVAMFADPGLLAGPSEQVRSLPAGPSPSPSPLIGPSVSSATEDEVAALPLAGTGPATEPAQPSASGGAGAGTSSTVEEPSPTVVLGSAPAPAALLIRALVSSAGGSPPASTATPVPTPTPAFVSSVGGGSTPAPTATPAPTPTPLSVSSGAADSAAATASGPLLYSLSSDRGSAVSIDGQTVTTTPLYAFYDVASTGSVERCRFYLDGALVQSEGAPPYDFRGGSTARANAWSPASGSYTIDVFCEIAGAAAEQASFAVTVALGSPSPAPTGTPAPTTTPTPTPAPGPTSTGPICTPVSTALTSLLSSAVGFGRHVTGGAAGCHYVVTNDLDSGPGSLRAGAELGNQWITFADDYTIQLQSNLMLASNTTIDGRGSRVEVTGGGIYMIGPAKSNFIIEISHAALSDKNDLLRVNWATDFWFDHLTLRDAADEYIDITRALSTGTRGTISWSRFERGGPLKTNEMAILIGDQDAVPTNHMLQVTLHHNYFDHTRQRHPLITGATVHSFNNFIGYRLAGFEVRCLGAAVCAQLVSEHDIIDASLAPSWNADWATHITDGGNRVRVFEPLLIGGAIVAEVDASAAFSPGSIYPYALGSTIGLKALLQSQAGAG